ncbi:Arf GTPase activating protein [Quillaja saponaria]|uniref:Arf GTPase activating protein n=1 Tax=Quillaja saponaria TaxID=32244 RepID=A0AAD7LZ56_QUISA|nr:Arf GTPase activating protein [Quillaja saponaria]KAJ7966092.1 Arf GTPase activating protein [Quillaja saponaria]
MGNRLKEDEKSEKAIRSLLKLPGNRRCINCNSLGPQYVCTTFWTFVCTNCSGVHREFTHRVKSVSMAKFNAEEVNALQAGGNERAKQIYFKEWDPQRHLFPDASNIHRLRDFIKHVYVDRKYTGERGADKLPRLRLTDKEESNEKNVSASRIELRSAHYEDRHERHHSERYGLGGRSDDRSFRYYYDERRSPRYAQENSRYGGYGRSPVRFEVVDDRVREDGFKNCKFSNMESKLRRCSPDGRKSVDRSRSPVVRPVGEVLGDKVLSLKVGEPSQTNPEKGADASSQKQEQSEEKVPSLQNVASSSGLVSGDENPSEHKTRNPESLIDISLNSQPPDAPAAPQTQPTSQSNSWSNWAPFEFSTTEKAPEAPKVNSLEFLLSELSGPLVVPTTTGTSEIPTGENAHSTATVDNMYAGGMSQPAPLGLMAASPNSAGGLEVALATAIAPAQPSNGVAFQAELSGTSEPTKDPDAQKSSSIPKLSPPASSAADNSSTTQPTSPRVGAVLNNQPWDSAFVPNGQGSLSASTELSFPASSRPSQDNSPGVTTQPSSVETKSSARKELPVDLFTLSYLPAPAPVAVWQNVQPHGMGFNMQYYPDAVPTQAFPVSAKATNPFDLADRKTQVQASQFPTMAALQGALPGVSNSAGLLHASSFGTQPSGMVPQSPSYASALPMPPQSSFSSVMPTGAYFDQVNNNMPPSRSQGVGSVRNDGDVFASLNANLLSAGRSLPPSNPNSFTSKGGNPFG